jgi:iron complex outermembrane receptor protein
VNLLAKKTLVASAVSVACLPAAWAQHTAGQTAQALNPITVTASTIDDRFGEDVRSPTSTTVISGKDIEAQHAENLIDVLKAIPGITADTQGGDELKIKFRGVDNQRYMGEKPGVAIVIDGVPVFERTGKVNIDLDNIESIKVIKGGASYLFGEDALSGAIIITTKKGAGNKGMAVEMDRGAYGYQRDLARLGAAGDRWSAHLQLSRRQADDWHFQSNYKAEALTGNVQWMPTDRSVLTFGFEKEQRFRDKHGTVTGDTQAWRDPKGTEGRDFARHFDVDLERLNLTYSNDLTDTSNLLANVYQFTDHTRFWSSPQKYSATGAPVTASDAYSTLNDYHQTQRGLKSEYRTTAGTTAFMLGGEIKRNEYLNNTSALTTYMQDLRTRKVIPVGTVFTDDLTRENVEALYGEVKWTPAKDWELTGNARHDRVGLDYVNNPVTTGTAQTDYAPRRFNANSYRLGVAWSGVENTTYFANVSTGFRVPTVDQLYRGSNGLNGRVDSNPNLRPEQATNFEVGQRQTFKLAERDASWQVTLFQIDRKDFILDTNGQYGSSLGNVNSRYENIGGARSRGVELALKSSFTPSWDWDLAYTWLDSFFTRYDRFVQTRGNPYGSPCAANNPNPNWANCYRLVTYNNTGKKVPRTPPHVLNLRTTWHPDEHWKFSAEMDYKASSWADEINQERWKGRTLFNLGVDYSRKLPVSWGKGAKLTAFLRVDNVFNRRYYTIARGTNDAQSYATGKQYDGLYNAEDLSITVDPGRVWRAGISVKF